MKPGEVGKKLGIGVRVAGRIARQRAEEAGRQPEGRPGSPALQPPAIAVPDARNIAAQAQQIGRRAPQYTRAAGRGIGGFLRPFGRVGSILWLEVTGVFFGLFAFYFATDAWRSRLDYAHGPLHQRFLISLGCTLVFTYLGVSAFWRARRK